MNKNTIYCQLLCSHVNFFCNGEIEVLFLLLPPAALFGVVTFCASPFRSLAPIPPQENDPTKLRACCAKPLLKDATDSGFVVDRALQAKIWSLPPFLSPLCM
mmetsp:Transcript_19652/g.28591  ORF Transcript_19652/g.28591 Transcript_19652/m.28591 type:complete len:102 (-) Transcript_19652:680-985(-)